MENKENIMVDLPPQPRPGDELARQQGIPTDTRIEQQASQNGLNFASLSDVFQEELRKAGSLDRLNQGRSQLVQQAAPTVQANVEAVRDPSQRVAGEAPSLGLSAAGTIGEAFVNAAEDAASKANSQNILSVFSKILEIQDRADEKKIAEEELKLKQAAERRAAAQLAAETGINFTTDPTTGELIQSVTPPQESEERRTIGDLLENLSANPDATKGITGKVRFGYSDESRKAEGQLKQLVGILQLENIEKLKGQGTITDAERQILKDSLANFNLDKNGRSRLSNEDFQAEIERLKELFPSAGQQQQATPQAGPSPTGAIRMTGPMGEYTVQTEEQAKTMEANGYRRI